MIGDIVQLRQEFMAICRLVYQRGLVAGAAGNISMIIPGTEYVLIKRSGSCLGSVTESDCMIIDHAGHVIEGQGRPSIEINFHLGIYAVRADVQAVIHTHPPIVVGFTNTMGIVPMATMTAELVLNRVPNIPYAAAGSLELADLVVSAFRDPEVNTISMTNHGAVSVGATLQQAFDRADILESTAQTALVMQQLQRTPV
ncbi:MAG: class II aldolase/adducin family protein [Bacillota bacterium]